MNSDRPSRPSVSVVIPVLNAKSELAACLDALAQQDAEFPFEVVVVDNGSAHPPADLIRQYSFARLVNEPRRGRWSARQTGVLTARGRILAFTDADCIPDTGWLRAGAARFQDTEACGLVAGDIRVTAHDPAHPTVAERYEMATAFRQEEYVRRWSFGASANVFTSQDVLAAIGGLDEKLFSGGDLDMGRRISAAGYKIVYEPAARVSHPARATLGEITRKSWRIATGLHQMRHRDAYRLRDLARDLRFDWPLLGDVADLLRSVGRQGILARIELLWMLAYVKAVRLTRLTQLDLKERLGWHRL